MLFFHFREFRCFDTKRTRKITDESIVSCKNMLFFLQICNGWFSSYAKYQFKRGKEMRWKICAKSLKSIFYDIVVTELNKITRLHSLQFWFVFFTRSSINICNKRFQNCKRNISAKVEKKMINVSASSQGIPLTIILVTISLI